MVQATHAPDKEQFFDFDDDGNSDPYLGRVAGSFRVQDADETGVQIFWYCCPCGCGSVGALRVGNGFKPAIAEPSWQWNGSVEKPTLTPSVNHVGHWHGFLTDGEWKPC